MFEIILAAVTASLPLIRAGVELLFKKSEADTFKAHISDLKKTIHKMHEFGIDSTSMAIKLGEINDDKFINLLDFLYRNSDRIKRIQTKLVFAGIFIGIFLVMLALALFYIANYMTSIGDRVLFSIFGGSITFLDMGFLLLMGFLVFAGIFYQNYSADRKGWPRRFLFWCRKSALLAITKLFGPQVVEATKSEINLLLEYELLRANINKKIDNIMLESIKEIRAAIEISL